MRPFLDGLAGLVTGVLSGWGIGGGSLLTVYLTGIWKTPRAEARSVNLLYFLPASLASLVWHVRDGLVVWRCAVPAAIAGSICAAGASLLSAHLAEPLLQKLFAAFLIAVGVRQFITQ